MQILSEAAAALKAVIAAIEKLDPNAANNPILIDVQKVLNILEAL